MLASKNEGKTREIRAILSDLGINVLSLRDFENIPDIREDGKTFIENALKKARIVSGLTGEVVLADDSGLEVDCLDGAPGVHSSRYSGSRATDPRNIRKLLRAMDRVPVEKRGASFRCVLVLYWPDGNYETFEGSLRGIIHEKSVGDGGFGYDPVFLLPERGLTVAQLSLKEKNAISHRARAVQKLKEHLRTLMST